MIDVGTAGMRPAAGASATQPDPVWRIVRSFLLLAGALGLRVILEASPATAGFIAGATFGGVLLAGWIGSGGHVARPTAAALPWGLLGGAVLILLPTLLHPDGPHLIGMRPEPFLLWVAVTVLVAVSEECLIRGVMFDAVESRAGTVMAVALTSIVFALMHVPLYGWDVVPIDLAAGVWLAGLRLTSGGVAAPGIAHVIADLATW